jgi:homoserine dehydrogenase
MTPRFLEHQFGLLLLLLLISLPSLVLDLFIMAPLRIGMIGGGTVGGGVYEIIMNRLASKCVVTKICVQNLNKPRAFHLDESVTKLTTDVNSILNDESIDIVVEVMGGTDVARTIVLDSLSKNKSVVTANKALVAEHLEELYQAAQQSKGVLSYEAAVCGGIPIIQTLHTCFTGDVIHQVMVGKEHLHACN